MVMVRFILPNNLERSLEVKPGTRLVSAGYSLGLDEIGFGDCGGNCTCGTCHVRVLKGGFPPAAADELAVMETFPKLYKESRLACQLRVTEAMDAVDVEWRP
ncbi:MAG: 2Fe-2S iron-sulfur cluster binding domain-containing protein [Proteobacteria bacterium]|nr:2Fe-2S iron-sulfur cluster binding domain-containing protein [Pseudomonadota bacterium]